jgi:hypothetical protein
MHAAGAGVAKHGSAEAGRRVKDAQFRYVIR